MQEAAERWRLPLSGSLRGNSWVAEKSPLPALGPSSPQGHGDERQGPGPLTALSAACLAPSIRAKPQGTGAAGAAGQRVIAQGRGSSHPLSVPPSRGRQLPPEGVAGPAAVNCHLIGGGASLPASSSCCSPCPQPSPATLTLILAQEVPQRGPPQPPALLPSSPLPGHQ